MKYRFITIMHRMKLETVKNRGVSLFRRARLSNGLSILEETLKTKLMKSTAGVHSVDEFDNTVYFYIDGEFEEIETKDEMDKVGTKYTFAFLRIIQHFLGELWEIKDNNVYVRDGFLIVYDETFEDGFTYKASLSAIFTRSNLEEHETTFTDDEVKVAIEKFQFENANDFLDANKDYRKATDDILFKYSKSHRIQRAYYFVLNARGSAILPMKIVSYCTALECLFTSSKSEINHKIAERVACLLGDTIEERKRLFKLVKKCYDVRSTIVHGSSLKGESEDLKHLSQDLDIILRKLLSEDNEIFYKKDDELDKFFIDLIFSDFNRNK